MSTQPELPRRRGLVGRAWHAALDNPLTRMWVGSARWLWTISPVSRLLPLDIEELWEALVELSTDLVARPDVRRERLTELLQQYNTLAVYAVRRLLGNPASPPIVPARSDRRFADKAWTGNLLFDLLKQTHLITAAWLMTAARDVQGLDPIERRRVAFYTRQFVDMLSPSNFALTNPEVLREILDTGGENLRRGLNNLLEDLQRGEIKIAGKEQFKVGVQLAITPGQVIYRNELMELIQYAPKTEQVYSVPIVIIPPWINKFYVMDIRPGRSMVEYLVANGFTVFMISWRNPDASLEHIGMEDYLRLGPLTALEIARAVTGATQAHLIGYCLGGTLLSILLAYLSAEGQGSGARDQRPAANGQVVTSSRGRSRQGRSLEAPIPNPQYPIPTLPSPATATLFTALQDFSETGETGIFINQKWLTNIEKIMARKGYLDATELSSIFRLMRANDLIWSFVVNNYLLGREPPAIDLVYWSVDGTRMPRAMHSYYLRTMYFDNSLIVPGKVVMLGRPIDLGAVKCPCYVVAGTEDHIVLWQAAHRARQLFSGPVRAVLSHGGHITAIINPPTGGKSHYFVADESVPRSAANALTGEAWLRAANRVEGSWWPDWVSWLAAASGDKVAPPPMGTDAYRPLVAAPGTYVLES